jgi:uncharacterized protein (TIGR03437 family)
MNIRVGILAILPILTFAGNEPSDFRRLPVKHGYLGSSPFTYREYQGWALVEGDILLAPLAEMRGIPAAAKTAPDKAATAVNATYRLWQDGIVYYSIAQDMEDVERIFEAFRHWEQATPIRFQQHTNQPNYVTFQPTYSGCNASVGAGAGVVNLSWECDVPATIHEIGHTLGLWHEQSRIDRDRWLHVRYENIAPEYRDQYDQQILDGADIGPYDFGSIMHYSAFGFSQNGGLTMQSKPAGIPIGEAVGVSALDIQAIHALYKFRMEKTVISSTPTGLKVVIDGEEHVTPAAFSWAEGETHTISAPAQQTMDGQEDARYHFAAWSDGDAAEHTITAGPTTKVFDARFARYVKVAAGPGVRISPPSEDGYYLSGSRVRLEAIAEEGFGFVGWSQPVDGEETYDDFTYGAAPNPLEITVVNRVTPYEARFAEGPITTLGGNVTGLWLLVDDDWYITPVRFAWKPGTRHEVLPLFYFGADYSTDYQFVRWPNSEDEILDLSAPETSTVINPELKAWHYVGLGYDWWIKSSDTRPSSIGYQLSPESPDGFYEAGTQLTVHPPEYDRWRLINWYLDASGSGPLQFTVDAPRFIIGNFFGYSGLNRGAIVNDASRQPGPITAGQRLRIHWSGSTPEAPLTAPADAPLPTILGGVEVRFNRINAQLLSVSKDEIVCLVPESVGDAGTATVVVVTGRSGTQNVDVPVLSRSPGLYVESGAGQGLAIARPAAEGDEIELRATGLNASEPAEVLIDNINAPVISAQPNPAEPGIWTVRAQVPAGLTSGRKAIYLLNGGRPSQVGVTLDVAAPEPR